jgi:8-oxo-dGTP diphosphatase
MAVSPDHDPVNPALGHQAGPVAVAVAAIWRLPGPCVLLTRRPRMAHLGGLWELPGGKIAPGESPQQALRRELLEEIGLQIGGIEPLAVIDHRYPDRAVRLYAFLTQVDAAAHVQHLGVDDHRWVALDELERFECPPATIPLLRMVRRRLQNRCRADARAH